MTSLRNIVILFSFTVLLISSTVRAKNPAIVDKLCHVTHIPSVCIPCAIPDDYKPPPETDVGVLEALLDCANNDMTQLKLDTRKIVDDPKTGGDTRETLKQCQNLFSIVHTYVGLAKTQVLARNFEKSKNFVDNFMSDNLGRCSTMIRDSGIEIPGPVFSGLLVVGADVQLIREALTVVRS